MEGDGEDRTTNGQARRWKQKTGRQDDESRSAAAAARLHLLARVLEVLHDELGLEDHAQELYDGMECSAMCHVMECNVSCNWGVEDHAQELYNGMDWKAMCNVMEWNCNESRITRTGTVMDWNAMQCVMCHGIEWNGIE